MIEPSLVISIVSVAIAAYVGITNIRRNENSDDRTKTKDDREEARKEATEMTAVIVKLENINDDTKEIKHELRNVRDEVGNLRERVIVAEQTTKSLHRRVDAMEERLN